MNKKIIIFTKKEIQKMGLKKVGKNYIIQKNKKYIKKTLKQKNKLMK